MNIREKTLKIIKREAEGFVPFQFELCPSLVDRFKKETGAENYVEYYDMPYFSVFLNPKNRNIDFSRYFKEVKAGTFYNEFGVAFEPVGKDHFTHMLAPMKEFTEKEDYENYPYPDAELDYDWQTFRVEVQRVKGEDKIAVGMLAMTIFEIGWYMRGMEECMVDMITEEDTLNYHFDRITEIRCRQAAKMCECGIDVLHLGDDIATQQSMMMSLELYRKWIKPRLKKVIDAARAVNPEIIIDYHSDGNCENAIEDLIEVGVNVLNPVQPECMDIFKIKDKFGDRLSFRGTIGTQTTLPFGNVETVKEEVMKAIEYMGKGGGLILAPSHMIEPEVPWENVLAFVETVEEYNNGKHFKVLK